MNRKLSRKKSNREHLITNLVTSLVLFETIDTTEAKAKEAKSYLEQIIARNKSLDLSAKRRIFSTFFDKNAAKKTIEVLIPRYTERKSGFIRSYHLKNRLGDNSPMMRLELVDKKVFQKESNTESKKNTKNEAKEVAKETKESKTDGKE